MLKKLKRKGIFTIGALCIALIAIVVAAKGADFSKVRINIDGSFIQSDVAPYINMDARTMVPVRFVSEALGFKVEWSDLKRRVTITGENSYGEEQELRLVIGEKEVEIANDTNITMDTAPVIKDGRTMVPVRFVSEAMGMQVGWISEGKIVAVTTRPYSEGNEINREDFMEQGWEGFFRSGTIGLWWDNDPEALRLEKGNGLLDLKISIHKPTLEVRKEVREILEFFYPTGYEEVYNAMLKVARQEIWDFNVSGRPEARIVADNRTAMIQLHKNYGLVIRIGSFGSMAFPVVHDGFDYSIYKGQLFKTDDEIQEYIKKYDLHTF